MIKKFLIRIIKLYQKYISPMKRTKCPYIPTCSQYGLEAIEKYGARDAGYTDRHAQSGDYSLDCLADDGQAWL